MNMPINNSILTISVIIPTYNRSKYIIKTLESFVNQNYPKDSYEIIIADNNSTDDTLKIVNEFINSIQQIRCTYLLEQRQGVHYARNTAAKCAQNEILYFTDDDMIADQDLLLEIIKPFQFDDLVADVTGRVLPMWEAKPPRWILNHCNNYLLSLLDPPDEFLITKDITFLYSCHQAIKKDVFFESGGFNPEYTNKVYLGDGETGLNIKIRNLGYKFGYNGKSVIYHMIPAQRMTQKYINKRISNSGNAHSYSEYREKKPKNIKFFFMIITRTLFRAPLHLIKLFFKSVVNFDFDYLRFFLAYWFYYYNRLRYDLKIIFSPSWKRFVLKRDWLSE